MHFNPFLLLHLVSSNISFYCSILSFISLLSFSVCFCISFLPTFYLSPILPSSCSSLISQSLPVSSVPPSFLNLFPFSLFLPLIYLCISLRISGFYTPFWSLRNKQRRNLPFKSPFLCLSVPWVLQSVTPFKAQD